jgi:hypothetical protein
MNDEDRKNIIRQLLNRVYGVSSQEYQERVWIKGLGPQCDSYDETVCEFFDTAADVIKNYREFRLTEYERDVLKEFWDKWRKFEDDDFFFSAEFYEFMHTPEWKNIMKKAQDVIKAFKFVYKWED